MGRRRRWTSSRRGAATATGSLGGGGEQRWELGRSGSRDGQSRRRRRRRRPATGSHGTAGGGRAAMSSRGGGGGSWGGGGCRDGQPRKRRKPRWAPMVEVASAWWWRRVTRARIRWIELVGTNLKQWKMRKKKSFGRCIGSTGAFAYKPELDSGRPERRPPPTEEEIEANAGAASKFGRILNGFSLLKSHGSGSGSVLDIFQILFWSGSVLFRLGDNAGTGTTQTNPFSADP